MPGPPVADTIWLHIGTEKTGTSTIQATFAANQALLAAQGILYPLSPILKGMRSHVGLVHSALKEGDIALVKPGIALETPEEEAFQNDLMSRLQSEIAQSGCKQVVLSSEHFSTALRKPPSIARLINQLRHVAKQIRVVVYLRPQYELYPSLFSTQVKGGRALPARPPTKTAHDVYNYNVLLERWARAPGVSGVAVRLFGSAHFRNGDLIDDFFAAIDADRPADLTLPKGWLNQRLDGDTVEFLRLVNGLDKLAAQPGPMRRALVQALEAMSERSGPLLPIEMLHAIEAAYRSSNKRVAKRYFPDRDGVLFPPVPSQTSRPYEALSTARAVEIAAGLFELRPRKLEFTGPVQKSRLDESALEKLVA